MKPFSFKNKFGRFLLCWIQHYNHGKYWKRRAIVINPQSKTPFLVKLYYLYYVKRTDAYHNCSFGTNLNAGASFASPPHLPHGPNGIIIGHDVCVGKKCIIYQQVTIAHGKVVIKDDVIIGAGAKILPNVLIRNNVRIGANCVVIEDIPANATVVLPKPRIILK